TSPDRSTLLEHEDAPGLWCPREFCGGQILAQRGHVQRAPVGPAEARHRRVRDRHLDIFDQLAGWTESVDPSTGDTAAPIAAFLVCRATIGATPPRLHRHQDFTRADRAGFRIVGITENLATPGIRVVHRAAVGTPREAVGHLDATGHARTAMVGVQPIKAPDRFFLWPLVHRAGPEPTLRRHLAIVEAIGRQIALWMAKKCELLV